MAEYTVTTYAELVEKAAESGAYVKIGNDIDVLTEYPNGDAPQLVINGTVNGDGHRINRLCRMLSGDSYCVVVNSGRNLINTDFSNIYTNQRFLSLNGSITNCRFAGIVLNIFMYMPNGSSRATSCSFNIEGKTFQFITGFEGVFNSCNIAFKSSSTELFTMPNAYSYTADFSDCYFDLDMPNLNGMVDWDSHGRRFDNNVFDIHTEQTWTIPRPPSNSSITIFNTTHAPNTTGNSVVIGVPDDEWLDAEYLASIGFTIAEVSG